MRHLIDKIWNRESLFSHYSDLHDLVMVRWDVCYHWLPWNCVLLTKDEAAGHFKLEDLKEVMRLNCTICLYSQYPYFQAYTESLVQKVKFKHIMARNYFRRLTHVGDHAQQSQTEVIDQEVESPVHSPDAGEQVAEAAA